MHITVPELVIENWGRGDNITLKGFLSDTIVVSTGETRLKSTSQAPYISIPCVLASGDLTIPETILDSLTDSSNGQALLTFYFFKGREKIDFWGQFTVPHFG